MKAAKQNKRHANKGSNVVEFRVGDLVYAKNHRRTNKFENRWNPYNKIIKQTELFR